METQLNRSSIGMHMTQILIIIILYYIIQFTKYVKVFLDRDITKISLMQLRQLNEMNTTLFK